MKLWCMHETKKKLEIKMKSIDRRKTATICSQGIVFVGRYCAVERKAGGAIGGAVCVYGFGE